MNTPRLRCLWLVVLLLVGVYSTARADNEYATVTLDELIEQAVTANPNLQAIRARHEAAGFAADATGRLPDPQVYVGVSNLPWTSLSLGETPMSGVALGLSQRIPWPGKLTAQSTRARLGQDLLSATLGERENEIVRMVRSAWYSYGFYQRAEEILRQTMERVHGLETISTTRYANGEGTAQNILHAQTTRARLENRVRLMTRGKASMMALLAELTNNDALTPGMLAASLDLPASRPHWSDTSAVLPETSPRLVAAETKVRLADRDYQLARQDYWPDLTLGLEYKARRNMVGDPVAGENFLSARVGFTVPLWFLSKQRNHARAARVGLEAARAEERAVQVRLAREITDTRLSLTAIMQNLDSYDTNIIPRTQATIKAARVAYEVGDLDFDALLKTHIDMLDIEMEQADLRKEFHLLSSELQELTAEK